VFGLDGREHGPTGAEADHLSNDLGLVALCSDVEWCAEPGEGLDDHGASVRAGGEQHPGPPRCGRVDVAVRRAVHGEFLGEQWLCVDAVDPHGRFDAHHEIEFTRDQQIEQGS